jgi:hypothetical protein
MTHTSPHCAHASRSPPAPHRRHRRLEHDILTQGRALLLIWPAKFNLKKLLRAYKGTILIWLGHYGVDVDLGLQPGTLTTGAAFEGTPEMADEWEIVEWVPVPAWPGQSTDYLYVYRRRSRQLQS